MGYIAEEMNLFSISASWSWYLTTHTLENSALYLSNDIYNEWISMKHPRDVHRL